MTEEQLNNKRNYQRVWIAKRRAQFFENKICIKCGSNKKLELDHIDPSTKITSSIWSWSKEKRNTELIKCQILCYDCHWKKTLSQRKKAKHGTGWMYQEYKCRCNICLEFKRKDNSKTKLMRKLGHYKK